MAGLHHELRSSHPLGSGNGPVVWQGPRQLKGVASNVAVRHGSRQESCLVRQVVQDAFCHACIVSPPSLLIPCPLAVDGQNAVLSSVLRGAGRQWTGAGLNLAGWWGVGVPLAYYLALPAGMGVQGLWGGFATASALQAVVQHAVVARMDWEEEVRRAKELVDSQDAGEGGSDDEGEGGGSGGGRKLGEAGRVLDPVAASVGK